MNEFLIAVQNWSSQKSINLIGMSEDDGEGGEGGVAQVATE